MKISSKIYLSILILIILTNTGCEKKFKESRFLLGTIVEVTVIGNKNNAKLAMESAFKEIDKADKLMNIFDKKSEVTRINSQASRFPVKVSNEVLDIIDQSIEFSKLTDDAFDISIAPVVKLWGFRDGNKNIPYDNEISEKLSLVNYRMIHTDHINSSVKLDKLGMEIDLGAIAAGYSVDKAIQKLKELGIKNALVNGGGEIYALGSPPKKETWTVGIQHPRRTNDLLGKLYLKDMAVSTSGDYENYYELNGKRYCHIINPKTGKPVQGIMSVTIVAENTTIADALSTAVFCMGAENGMKFIKKSRNLEGIIVTGTNEKDMRIMISDGLKDKIEINKGNF